MDIRVVILRRRVSKGHFVRGSVDIFEGCSEDYMYLFLIFILDTLFLYMGLVATFDIHCTYLIYMLMYVSFAYLYMCCFFSLFMHMLLITCMQSIISISHKNALMSFV